MPVDPKYVGLPGIAWDQPDLFETIQGGDDDSTENTDTESEDQEKLHLSSLSWVGDMEVGVEQDEKETIMQRFLRLRCEIGELMEDLDEMTESTRQSSHSEGLSIQVKTLSSQLEACQMGTELDASTSGNVGLENLTKQISALKSSGKDKKTEEIGGIYQVYLKNENQGTVDVANLDTRLAVLEKAVGNIATNERKVLSSQTDNQNLGKSMKILEDRKAFLRPQHIDHVEGRLSALNFKINSISEQKSAVDNATKDDKVNKLASLVTSQSSLASGVLPEMVERLEVVTSLREAAETWVDVVEGVEQQQRETKEVIKDTEKDLVETRDFFDKNIAGIHEKYNLLHSNLGQIK